MSADREHEAKVRAMEAAMSGELADVTRIGPPQIPTLTNIVRIVTCYACRGDGYVELRTNRDGIGEIVQCAICAGRGRVVTDGGEV
jgi:hypothetical protein